MELHCYTMPAVSYSNTLSKKKKNLTNNNINLKFGKNNLRASLE